MSNTLTKKHFHHQECGTSPRRGDTVDEAFRRMVERFPDPDAVVSVDRPARGDDRGLDGRRETHVPGRAR